MAEFAATNKYLSILANDANPEKAVNTENLIKLFLVVFQVAFILLISYLFRIERDHGLVQILPIIFFGFLIHLFLPAKFRLPFFTVLSACTFALVLGLRSGVIVIGIGLGLLSLCHLPIPYWLRVISVVIVAGVLAVIRSNWISVSWGTAVVPMLASMFMFRLIVYLYELKQKKTDQATIWQRISYFFLLPNICFPFFPIVDYRTYIRAYFNEDPLAIIQKGINFMVLGIIQLLIYRIIYAYFAIGPENVIDTKTLLIYLSTSYAILIKLSGQAHFIVGVLCLFGFNLPRVFDNYFLATGPNEYWRRINIYWKDFMMRVFYYPFFFKVRRWGMVWATAVTLIFIFAITAILHSYQFFWLQGTFRLTAIDAIFWGVLGVMVVINSLMQMKNTKKLRPQSLTFLDALKRSFQIILFSSVMCILWSTWRSTSLHEWISLFLVVRKSNLAEIGIIGLIFVGAVFVGAIIQVPVRSLGNFSFLRQRTFYKTAFMVLVLLSVITVLRMNRFYTTKESKLKQFITSIQVDKLTNSDADEQERGYYENIMDTNRLSMESISVGKLRPLDWVELHQTKAVRFTNNILIYEPLPYMRIKFKNQQLTTNQWGMRDKPYEREKPIGTYRFALLGGSFEMGSGVADQETYESLIENRLNEEYGQHYEILNFAVGGYGLERQVKVIETKVFPFHPDAVIYVAHTREIERSVTALIRILNAGVIPEYDFLKDIVRKSGFKRDMDPIEAERSLLPYTDQILTWSYRRIADDSREHGAIPVWVFLPTLEGRTPRDKTLKLISLARKLGFVTIDLSTVYGSRDLESLQCATWDNHPGNKAHRLIANLLYKKLIENQQPLHLKLIAKYQPAN